jgi:hypothetical protein
MKFLFLSAFLFSSVIAFSQTIFENGYFIGNDNHKTDCLIKNIDWKNNPTEFIYKTSADSNELKNSITEVKEFYIQNKSKFIRNEVEIDTSSESSNDISYTKEPLMKRKTVFLKVLVEGINTLYIYEGEYSNRFFFSTKTLPVQQLIFKKYHNPDDKDQTNTSDISYNNKYKQQLMSYVNCNIGDEKKIKSLSYTRNDLIKYFLYINSCLGDTSSNEISKSKKGEFNFRPLIGINNSSIKLGISSGNLKGNYDLGNKISATFGFELELVLPYYNNNWSVVIEPSYTMYKGTYTIVKPIFINGLYNTTTTYKYIQLPLIIRRYLHINDNSKIILNGGINYSISSKSSKIDIEDRGTYDTFDGNKLNYLIGVGYLYKKYLIELRQYTNIDLNNSISSKDSYIYKNLSLLIKYQLF